MNPWAANPGNRTMPPTPSIRKFEHQEWPIFRDLRLRALVDAPDAFGSTLGEEEGRPGSEWARRLVEGSDVRWNLPLLAEVDSEPAGLAWGRIVPSDPERADLYQMWVAPGFRCYGVGRLLLEEVIKWARGAGAQYLALGATCGETAANRLYSRAGFEAVGEPEPLRPNSSVLAQPMRLPLREGAA